MKNTICDEPHTYIYHNNGDSLLNESDSFMFVYAFYSLPNKACLLCFHHRVHTKAVVAKVTSIKVVAALPAFTMDG